MIEHQGLEVSFRPDPYIYDGSYANNAWLQELPHPMTKLTWDNAVHLSPAMARRAWRRERGCRAICMSGGRIRGWSRLDLRRVIPMKPLPSHFGYGHTHLGRAANGAGFNAYLLRTSDALGRIVTAD